MKTLWSVVAVVVLLGSGMLMAQDTLTWQGGTETWDDSDTANWDLGQVPVNGDTVNLTESTASDIAITYASGNFSGGNALQDLTLNNAGAGSTTFTLDTGDTLQVGRYTYIESGGKLVVNDGIFSYTGASTTGNRFYIDGGQLELHGGMITNNAGLSIEAGSYKQYGGTFVAYPHAYLADSAGMTASMEIQDGLFKIYQYDFNARSGDSTMTIGGGEFDIKRYLYLGTVSGTHNWTMTGGVLRAGSTAFIGGGTGSAWFDQSGGLFEPKALGMKENGTAYLNGDAKVGSLVSISMDGGTLWLDGPSVTNVNDFLMGYSDLATTSYCVFSNGYFRSRGFGVGSGSNSVGIVTHYSGALVNLNADGYADPSTSTRSFRIGCANGGSGRGEYYLWGGTNQPTSTATTTHIEPNGLVEGYGRFRPGPWGMGYGDISGIVRANGQGVERTLDFSMGIGSRQDADPYVHSEVENTSDKGWYAVNKGLLKLEKLWIFPPGCSPSQTPKISPTNGYSWGEAMDDTDVDLVNSVRVVFDFGGATTIGKLEGLLYATDRSDVPGDFPGEAQPIGVWQFTDETFTFTDAVMTFRYDDALRASLGLVDGTQRILQHDGSDWVDITASLDQGKYQLTTSALTSFGMFAVTANPPPSGSLFMLR